MEDKQIVHAQMPSKLVRQAKIFAANQDISLSKVLRLALSSYLMAAKNKK